jgi:serine/threonine protein kinase
MIGRTLAHFKITAKLGEGGMGEVYRARDERLDREVALKLLPSRLAAEPERMERFRREAQMIASLSHPGIGAIYGLEEDQGTTFLVLELVEGEDLSERLARGPLPIAEALHVAVQIATALEVAHERGIVHRDLKPSNVKLGADGNPRILDFGLAKIYTDTPLDGPENTYSPTAIQATEAGMILGTAAYMAPEQAQGEHVDKRADIWAFGVVLFEMLTGRRLFAGSTFSETLLAVLSQDLEWSRLPEQTPKRVRRVLERCLSRDPLKRLRDIGEARIRLQEGEEPDDATPNGFKRPFHRLGALIATGLGVLLLVAGAFLIGHTFQPLGQAGDSRNSFKLDLELGGLTLQNLGEAFDGPKISPDGKQLLYPAEDGIRIRRLTELDSVSLPGTDGASYVFWSPDGGSIAYARAGRLWRRPANEGSATDLGEVPEKGVFGSGGGAWNTAGELVLAGSPSVGLLGFTADGRSLGELLSAAEGEADFHEISSLPDDHGFLFTVHGPDGIDTIAALVGGRRKDILRLPGEALAYPSYSPTGHLLYERETINPGLWAVRFSLESMQLLGEPFLVIPNATMPSRADDGTLVFVRRNREPADLVKIGRDGSVQPVKKLAASTRAGSRGWFDLSPDGRRVAIPLDARPYGDLWVVDLESGTQARLDSGWVGFVGPLWMPDSSQLVYGSLRGSQSTWKAWIASADGSQEPKKLRLADADIAFPLAVSPDGEWLVYAPPGEGLIAVKFDNPTEEVTIARETGMSRAPAASISPDGNWLAYQTEDSGSLAVWVQPFPPDGRRWPVSTEQGALPRWSSSGTELFYRSGSRMMVVGFEPGTVPTVSSPTELFSLSEDLGLSRDFEPLRDDEGFLMVRTRGGQKVTVLFDLPSLIFEAEERQRASF